jgi:serine/threonine protein kinase
MSVTVSDAEELERYCPVCDARMFDTVCPTHRVKTVPARVLHEPSEGLAEGSIVAERYEIVRPLGQGAMGVVYLAKQLSVGRRVALKLMSRDVLRGGSEGIRRFHEEAAQASQLEHPNIVRIHDFGVDDALELPFIAMEFVEGETLQDILRRGSCSVPYTIAVVSQMARALTAAHAAGIVHRDLKPENVMVGELPGAELHVTVLDFGIAKTLRTPQGVKDGLTASGVIIGTPRYMSPEQVMGQDVDGRSDLYALGCILHEMLEGKPLFSADDPTGVMLKHVNAMVPPLSAADDGPHPLAELHDALLAKKPADRPASAEAVRRTLAELSTPFAENGSRPAEPAALESEANPGAVRSISMSEATPGDGSAGEGFVPAEPSDDALSQTFVRPRRAVSDSPLEADQAPSRRPRAVGVAVVFGLAAVFGLTAVGGSAFLSGFGGPGAGGPSDSASEPSETVSLTDDLPTQAPVARVDNAPGFVHPLSDRTSVLACPLWKAEGVEEPSGWLGAAGAFAACERARWLLGGRVERTLVPAELLDFPSLPEDDFPEDPYADPGLLERSVSAARQRGAAWLEGTIRLVELGRLTAQLRVMTEEGQIGEVIEAEGRAPFEAAWNAIDAAVEEDALPRQMLEPEVAEWWMLADVDWALLQSESTERMVTGVGLDELCPRARDANAPLHLLELRPYCKAVLGASPLAAFDVPSATAMKELDGPSLVWLANSFLPDQEGFAAIWSEARHRLAEETSVQGRHLLAVAEAVGAMMQQSPVAPSLWRRILLDHPRTGLNVRLTYKHRSGESGGLKAWRPWHPGFNPPFRTLVLGGAQHSPDPRVTVRWGRRLVSDQRYQEALDFAARLLDGHPFQRAAAIALQARVAAARGRISAAADILESLDTDRFCRPCGGLFREFWGLSPAFDRRAQQEANRTCLAAESGQLEILDRDKPHLLTLSLFQRQPDDACVRTFERWVQRNEIALQLLTERPVSDCRAGVQAWLRGRRADALASWRRLPSDLRGIVCPIPTGLIADLDPELAAKWDHELSDPWNFGGAHPRDVRAYRRARKSGDDETATRLAQKVVSAWKDADLRIPVVDELEVYLAERGAERDDAKAP